MAVRINFIWVPLLISAICNGCAEETSPEHAPETSTEVLPETSPEYVRENQDHDAVESDDPVDADIWNLSDRDFQTLNQKQQVFLS